MDWECVKLLEDQRPHLSIGNSVGNMARERRGALPHFHGVFAMMKMTYGEKTERASTRPIKKKDIQLVYILLSCHGPKFASHKSTGIV
jgi:hypothetical protein